MRVDVADPRWWRSGDEFRDEVCNWLRRHGLNPDHTCAYEIVDEGQLAVERWERDETGRVRIVVDDAVRARSVVHIAELPPLFKGER